MWEEADDELEGSPNPLPDPSTRHWRHPSELAQHNALPHSDPTPIPTLATDPTRPLRPLTLVGGAVVVLVAGMLLVGPGDGLPTAIDATALGGAGTAAGLASTNLTAPALTEPTLASIPALNSSQSSSNRDISNNATPGPDNDDAPAEERPRPGSTIVSTTVPASTTTLTSSTPERSKSLDTPTLGVSPSPGEPTEGDDPAATKPRTMAEPEPSAWGLAPFGLTATGDPESALVAAVVVVNGHFVTSASAVAKLDRLWLRGFDQSHEVGVTAVDTATDIALLDLPLSETTIRSLTPPITLSPEQPTIGMEVIVGPLTGAGTVADGRRIGKVFALDRVAQTGRGTKIFDAVGINLRERPGDPGSTVFDTEGRLIGLVIEGRGPNLSALPIQRVLAIADALDRYGVGDAAWLGIEADPTNDDGLLVESIAPSSPANIELATGDVLLAVGGEPLQTLEQLEHRARLVGPGGSLTVTRLRDGEVAEVSVWVGSILDREWE